MSLFLILGQAYVSLILGLTFRPNVTLTYAWPDFFEFREETDGLLLMSGQAYVQLTFDLLCQEYVTHKYELAYGLSYTLTITDDQRSQVLLLLNMRTKMMFNLLFTYTSANLFFKKKPAAGYLLQTIP